MSEAGMVIAGAGLAGARAVIGLREHGWEGPIALIGEESLAPYDRPPLSKAAIANEEEPSPVFVLDEDMLASLKATWIGGAAATGIDRQAKTLLLADGRSVPYRKLLIATGARPRTLNIPGAERALLLRTFAESTAIRASFTPGAAVAIVGGGFIGLELASSAAKRGCAVTVVEALPRVLMRAVPEEIASVVAKRHADAGVTVLTGASVDRIDAKAVILKDGWSVAADIAIAGVGAVPEIELARTSGLAIDNGVACDDRLRTGDPDIYASGDCCSFPHPVFGGARMRLEAWRAAQDQAKVAAENMLGGDKVYDAIPWFWSDQFELTLQIAGVPRPGDRIVRRTLGENAFIAFNLDETGRLTGASGIGPGNSIARDVRLAELLIARRAAPAEAALADPSVQLRAMLKG